MSKELKEDEAAVPQVSGAVHAPHPTTLIAAGMVAAVLVTNMIIDGDKYLSLALVVVFAAVLGVDVSRFLRRGGPE